MPKKKQGATTFEGGEGATASVTVEPRHSVSPRKPDPNWVLRERKRKARNPRDKRRRRANEDISWEGYKAK